MKALRFIFSVACIMFFSVFTYCETTIIVTNFNNFPEVVGIERAGVQSSQTLPGNPQGEQRTFQPMHRLEVQLNAGDEIVLFTPQGEKTFTYPIAPITPSRVNINIRPAGFVEVKLKSTMVG